MGGRAYPLEPVEVPPLETKYRRICTKFPVPESLPILEELRAYEPRSMTGQPPVVWERAVGFQVYDRWGNRWLDWSSGVLVAGAGHGRHEIADAMIIQANKELLHNYCFPSEIRARLAKRLLELAPPELDKVFILTTGSETTENAIKLAKTFGRQAGGKKKNVFVSFDGAFHGRTLGAQLAGGIPALKDWINPLDKSFVQVPFPGDFRLKDHSFDLFLKTLKKLAVKPASVCGVMSETYAGGTAAFMPAEYAQSLREWCEKQQALLIFDEVQAGFGRTGKMFGFEHYGVVPDVACFGKGISSSLPMAAVLGRRRYMDVFEPGSMTSTHTGNPVCCAAALANLDIVVRENLPARAAAAGAVLHAGLERLKQKYAQYILAVNGKGMVAGVQVGDAKRRELDGELAWNIVANCLKRGVLMFSPVGPAGATVKIAPPIITPDDAIEEGVSVLDEAIAEATG